MKNLTSPSKIKLMLIAVAAALILMTAGCEHDDSQLKIVSSTHSNRQELTGILQGLDYSMQLKEGEFIPLTIEQSSTLLNLKGYNSSLPFEDAPLQLVDHEQFSILFGSVGTTNGVASVEQSFKKENDVLYEYKVIVICGITAVAQGTSYGIVTNKISNGADIKFNVEVKY